MMNKWQSFTALKRVKLEIEAVTEKVGLTLDDVLSTPNDEEKNIQSLSAPVAAYASIPGVLELLGFPCLSLLAQEIHLTLNDTLRNSKGIEEREQELRLELAYVCITDLPALLEDELKNASDSFEYVFLLINRLRKSRGRALVFESRILLEKRSVDFNKQFIECPEKMREILTRQYDGYSKCCTILTKDRNNAKALQTLGNVINNLALLLRDYKVGGLWGLAGGIFDIVEKNEEQRETSIEYLVELGQCLQKIDRGDLLSLHSNIDEPLLDTLLNYIAATKTTSQRLDNIRQWYSLDAALLRSFKTEYRDVQVAYYNKAAFYNSLLASNEEINDLIKNINTLSNEENIKQESVSAIYDRLFRLRNVMCFLGMEFLAGVIDQAIQKETIEEAFQDIEDSLTLAAGILFSLGKELDNKLITLEHGVFSSQSSISEVSTLSSAKYHIYSTAMKCVETVITAVDQYVENNCQGDEANKIKSTLDELTGVFAMVQLDSQVQQLEIASAYMKSVIENKSDQMPDENFHLLSSLVINWLWYLEQLSIGGSNDSAVYIERGENLAGRLQYYLDSLPECAEETLEVESDVNSVGDIADAPLLLSHQLTDVEAVEQQDAVIEDGIPVLDRQLADADSDSDGDDEINAIFAEEFDEVLGMIIEQHGSLAENLHQLDAIKECRRYFHTLKGSGNMVGATDIGTLGFAMEKVFDHLAVNSDAMTEDVMSFTGRVIEILPALKEGFINPQDSSVAAQTITDLCRQAEQLITDKDEAEVEDSRDNEEEHRSLDEMQAMQEQVVNEADNKSLHSEPDDTDTSLLTDTDFHHGVLQEQSGGQITAEQTAIAFCGELSDLNETLGALLGDEKSPAVTTDLLIPMHTIYGNARVHQLDKYSIAVQMIEKTLERFPHRYITADMAGAFQQFCDITRQQIHRVESCGQVIEYEAIDSDIDKLSLSLESLGISSPRQQATVDINKNIPHAPEGFITEARELVARIDLYFQQLGAEENSAESAGNIKQSLEFLASAAELAQVTELQRVAASMSTIYGELGASNMAGILLQQESLLECHRYLEDAVEKIATGRAPENCDALLQALGQEQDSIAHNEGVDEQSADAGETTDASIFTMLESSDGDSELDQQQVQAIEEEVDQSLLAVFLDEADELLEELDHLYLQWHENPQSEEVGNIIDEYLRILHTLKGSAALMMEKDISRCAHDYETFIISSRDNNSTSDVNFFNSCDTRLHELHDIYGRYSRDDDGQITKAQLFSEQPEGTLFFDMKALQEATQAPDADIEIDHETGTQLNNETGQSIEPGKEYTVSETALIEGEAVDVEGNEKDFDEKAEEMGEAKKADKEILNESITTPVQPPETVSREMIKNPAEEYIATSTEKEKSESDVKTIQATVDEQVRVSSQLLRSLLNDADEINFSRNRIEKDIHDINAFLVDMDETLTRLKSYVKRVDDSAKTTYQSAIEESRSPVGIADEFDALEMDRYTELQEMSLSLTEDYDDLKEIRVNLAGRLKDIDSVLLGQQRFTHSLQGGLISSQMVSFTSVVPRLKRLVRQISRELNKDVLFEVDCRQDNLDKNVLQTIITPLEHLLRNAMDHGIESSGQRLASGKAEQAKLTVSIARAGAGILIQIKDDGQGIDTEKVKLHAIKMGLLSEGKNISPEDVYQFIFQPGFSTSDAVSEISGRGVGLDAVKSEITHIGGNVNVVSHKGKGTTFTIHLPMTSSLDRALLFDVQDTRYVVQMNTLDGVMVKKLSDIHQKLQQGETPVFEYNGSSYEYLYLGKLINQDYQPRLDSIESSVVMLLVSGTEKNVALHIDAIAESRDLVVKSLGKQLAAMEGIAGGVIMPDGNVAVVLDLVAMVNSQGNISNPAMTAALVLSGKTDKKNGVKTVMVVDDSITVRKVTSNILKRNGMQVLTAKNGLEAIDMLEKHIPDIILLDIEMPKMDGFEVASHIRSKAAPIRNIPIIMITSRIGDKHRSRADDIGVNEYLCKPFLEDNLLDFIDSY